MLRTHLSPLIPRRHFLARWFLVAAIGAALTFITRATAAELSTESIPEFGQGNSRCICRALIGAPVGFMAVAHHDKPPALTPAFPGEQF